MKKSMKKAGILACCALLLFGMAACGKKTEGEDAANMTPAITATSTPAPTATPEPTATPVPTATPKPTEAPDPYEAYTGLYLKNVATKNNFTLGTVINYNQLSNKYYIPMVQTEFHSVTTGNEMKAYSLLNQQASMNNSEGMPEMNYSQADEILTFVQENGLKMRGHVLVWDAYMSDWFFREGYKSDGAYVDEATLKARLKYYIDEVITHFETNFPGVVYCWDVVNEAVGDGGDFRADDPRHVRTTRNGEENMFRTIIGEDYVEFSFACARETVEKLQAANPEVSIDLFYNDYNTFYDNKRDAIIELVKSINSYVTNPDGSYKQLCDGIGMQSYIGGYGQQAGCMNSGDITRVETAIRKFHELGVKVHVTEMAVRNYDKNQEQKHAEFYGKLFETYRRLNEEEQLIENVTIWGICDDPMMSTTDYSYKMNGPYCGLFNRACVRKNAYYEAMIGLIGDMSLADLTHEPAKLEDITYPKEYGEYNKNYAGSVKKIEYTTYAYADNGEEITKPAYVLLPPKYDESKQYNVLYLMHGVGGTPSEWNIANAFSEIRCAMDKLMYYGEAEEFIIVVPYGRSNVNYTNKSMANAYSFYAFGQELRNDLIPYIDEHYATYADYEEGYDLTAARDHRAMAGLSMGGMQTINIGLCECLDIISYFGAFSAAPTSNEAEVIAEALQNFEGYDINYFYSLCGTEDGTAYHSAAAAVEGLDALTDKLTEGENFMWHKVKGDHEMRIWHLGLYNFAQMVFK